MDKLLFLDIDGVLNSEHFYCNRSKSDSLPYPLSEFDPISVKELNRILDETDAKLIISSSWRFDEGLDNIFMKVGITHRIFGITPCLRNKIRGEEIKSYIEEYTKIERNIRYVILDDDADMLDEQKPFFVRTNAYGKGLTNEVANKTIEILNS